MKILKNLYTKMFFGIFLMVLNMPLASYSMVRAARRILLSQAVTNFKPAAAQSRSRVAVPQRQPISSTSSSSGLRQLTARASSDESQKFPLYVPPFEAQRKKFYQTLVAKPWKKAVVNNLTALEEREKACMDDFYKLSYLTPKGFHAIMKSNQADFDQDAHEALKELKQNGPVADDVRKRIENWFGWAGFKKGDIKIRKIYYPEEGLTLMAARAYGVLIGDLNAKIGGRGLKNPHYGTPHSKQATITANYPFFDSIFLHELVHILSQHSYRCGALGYILNERCGHQEKIKQFMQHYNHLTEETADITSGLVDPKYAFQAYELFSQCNDSDLFGDEHPKPSIRAAYMKKLHDEMEAAKNEYEKD